MTLTGKQRYITCCNFKLFESTLLTYTQSTSQEFWKNNCTVSDQVLVFMWYRAWGQSQDWLQCLQCSLTHKKTDPGHSTCHPFYRCSESIITSRQGLNQNTRFAHSSSSSSLFHCLASTLHNHKRRFITKMALCCSKIRPRFKPTGEKCNRGPMSLFLVGGLPLVEDGHQASYMSLWECCTSVYLHPNILPHTSDAFVCINLTSQTLQLLLQTQCRRIQ